MEVLTDYTPKEFKSLLVASSSGDDDSLLYLAAAMRFMSMARPVDYAELDSTYEEGRALIQEHLADLVEYAERLKHESFQIDSRKIQELEDQLTKHKRARELQELINKADFSNLKETFKITDIDSNEVSQERKEWLENACSVSEKMRLDDWKEELNKVETSLNDALSPDSVQSDSDILTKDSMAAA